MHLQRHILEFLNRKFLQFLRDVAHIADLRWEVLVWCCLDHVQVRLNRPDRPDVFFLKDLPIRNSIEDSFPKLEDIVIKRDDADSRWIQLHYLLVLVSTQREI